MPSALYSLSMFTREHRLARKDLMFEPKDTNEHWNVSSAHYAYKGKYDFEYLDLSTFFIKYSDALIDLQQKNDLRDCLGYQERYLTYIPIIIDVDLILHDAEIGLSSHTKETIILAFCYAIRQCLQISFDDERLLFACLLEKEQLDTQVKTGFHIQFPFIVVDQLALKLINRRAIQILQKSSLANAFHSPLDKIIDCMVHKNWNLYGSVTDIEKRPYLLTQIYHFNDTNKLDKVSLEETLCIAFRVDHYKDALRKICFGYKRVPDIVPDWDTKPLEWYLPLFFSINTYFKEGLNRDTEAFQTFRLNSEARYEAENEELALKQANRKRNILRNQVIEDDEQPILHYDFDTLRKLALLIGPSVDYCDEWFSIGSAIFTCTNGSDQGYQLFLDVSRKTSRDNFSEEACYRVWSNYVAGYCNLGTLIKFARKDNPEQFARLDLSKLQSEPSPFTLLIKKPTAQLTPDEARRLCAFLHPDIVISEPKITEKMYLEWFLRSSVVCLQSPMSSGKTHNLPILFKQFRRILFIGNRRSLEQSYLIDFGKYGFVLYSMCEEGMIYKDRVIVQIDSLPRIAGEFDLVICDEIELTVEHLMGFTSDRKTVYERLRNYLEHTPHVLFCDALLRKETIQIFLKDRNPLIIQNTVLPYSNTSIQFMSSKDETLCKIIDNIKLGKRIVVPTNSIRFAEDLQAFLQEHYPHIPVACITGAIHMDDRIPPEQWSNYDVLIYTSAVSAGISFTPLHFDLRICYFRNDSACAKICVQMITRIRQTKESIIYICCEQKQFETLPVKRVDVERFIDNLIHVKYNAARQAELVSSNEDIASSAKCNYTDGLLAEYPHFSFVKDDYYHTKVSYLQQFNLSKRYFQKVLSQCLILHGMKIIENTPETTTISPPEQETIKQDIAARRKQIKQQEYTDIADATLVSDKQYSALLAKPDKTAKEEHQIIKFSLVQTYQPSTDITADFVKDLHTKKQAYRNLCSLNSLRNFNLILRRLLKLHYDTYYHACQTVKKESINADPFREGPDIPEKITLIDHSQSYNLIETNHLWIKMFYAMKLLASTGLPELWSEEPFVISFKAICETFQQNTEPFIVLFNTKKKKWTDTLEKAATNIAEKNEAIRLENKELERKNQNKKGKKFKLKPLLEIWNDTDLRKGLVQQVNHIISSVFGLILEKEDHNKADSYICIAPLFQKWKLNFRSTPDQPRLLQRLLSQNVEDGYSE
jgi:hypothetical protein